MSYVYDDGDHITRMTLPSGRVVNYSRDGVRRVEAIDTTIEDNAYLYDRLDRLTSDAIDGNTPIDYTYDQNDNRLTKLRQDMTLKEFFEQQENSNRLSVIEAVKAGLAPIENLPNRDLVYNDVGRLFQLIEEGTLKAEYIYNDAGQRTRKTIYQADGISVDSITIYHYDQMGNLITETTETGALIKDYIWQEGMTPVAQITAMEGGNTGNAGAVASEIISYLHTDHLMTNRLATDQSQSVVWRWEGEAFGNTAAQESAGLSVNLRFPGQYYDQETNLHYNHFRYYDPELGRYITSDPIGLSSGTNTYSYVLQNPIHFSDPLGLYPGEESVDYVRDAIGGAGDFIDNYRDMRDANTIGADKYFHCKANCEASQRGEGGEDAACTISDAREWFGENVKGGTPSASAEDQIANQFGSSNGAADPSSDCSTICAPFRPLGLDPKY